MRKVLKALGICILLVVSGCGMALWWAAQATQEVPEFYRVAVQNSVANVKENTEELKSKVEELSTNVARIGQWQATFTADQINAWFISDLATRFPNVLPKGTQDPRVLLEPGKVMVAARYQGKRFDSIISFDLDIRLTEEPNTLEIKVNRLRAGSLPIPISRFSSKITKATSNGKLNIRWVEQKGAPVAFVEIPSEHERYRQQPVIIEEFEVRSGELFLSGRTGIKPDESKQPD